MSVPSCNQQNYPINCNFRRASSKHLITLMPKIYPFFSKSLSKILSANGLPRLLPVGQVRGQSYLPEPKIYLSRTTGRGLFRALMGTSRLPPWVGLWAQNTVSQNTTNKGILLHSKLWFLLILTLNENNENLSTCISFLDKSFVRNSSSCS